MFFYKKKESFLIFIFNFVLIVDIYEIIYEIVYEIVYEKNCFIKRKSYVK